MEPRKRDKITRLTDRQTGRKIDKELLVSSQNLLASAPYSLRSSIVSKAYFAKTPQTECVIVAVVPPAPPTTVQMLVSNHHIHRGLELRADPFPRPRENLASNAMKHQNKRQCVQLHPKLLRKHPPEHVRQRVSHASRTGTDIAPPSS